MTPCRPPACSATGGPVAEWLGYPLTDYRKSDILQVESLAGTEMHFEQLKRREFITLVGGVAAGGARSNRHRRSSASLMPAPPPP
jgi:hypothetical protein